MKVTFKGFTLESNDTKELASLMKEMDKNKIQRKVRRKNSSYNKWTEEEKNIVRENINAPVSIIRKFLNNSHTKKAIHQMKHKVRYNKV
jgi:hypothetical protein